MVNGVFRRNVRALVCMLSHWTTTPRSDARCALSSISTTATTLNPRLLASVIIYVHKCHIYINFLYNHGAMTTMDDTLTQHRPISNDWPILICFNHPFYNHTWNQFRFERTNILISILWINEVFLFYLLENRKLIVVIYSIPVYRKWKPWN